MKSVTEQFKNIKVLVVGDVMVDAYYFGKVERISPEAPVPVVAVEKKENRPGGAANVAMNLVALGAKPVVCSVIGKDSEGDVLEQLFVQAGVGTEGLIRSSERVTTVKTRVIAQQTQMLRIDQEMTSVINANESKLLTEKIISLLPGTGVLIFEDYDKGVLSETVIAEITKAANAAGVPVVVDPKKKNFAAYKNAFLFKPNLKELKEGIHTDVDPENTSDFENHIHAFMNKMGIQHMMITMSERGVMITNGTQVKYIPAHIRKIADVSGAGDTVISVAALCVASGFSNEKVAGIANLAGGLVCEEVGVVPIDPNKLEAEIIELGLNQ